MPRKIRHKGDTLVRVTNTVVQIDSPASTLYIAEDTKRTRNATHAESGSTKTRRRGILVHLLWIKNKIACERERD